MKLRRDSVTARQLGAMALTSAGLPIFRLCCRISWPWVLLGGAGAAGLLSLLTRRCHRRGFGSQGGGKAVLVLLLSAGAVAAAWESGFAFPETAENWLAVLLVLALAFAAAWVGPAAAGRCAGILLWVTAALYGTVLVFSLPQLRPERLLPAGRPTDALLAFAALLLPGAALCLRPELGEPRLPCWPWWTACAGAAAASLVTGGILSPALAREPEAFRTLARGVSVLGVIRRFEALVNGAMLMSGFCLCTLYLTALRSLLSREKTLKKFFEKTKKSVDK